VEGKNGPGGEEKIDKVHATKKGPEKMDKCHREKKGEKRGGQTPGNKRDEELFGQSRLRKRASRKRFNAVVELQDGMDGQAEVITAGKYAPTQSAIKSGGGEKARSRRKKIAEEATPTGQSKSLLCRGKKRGRSPRKKQTKIEKRNSGEEAFRREERTFASRATNRRPDKSNRPGKG